MKPIWRKAMGLLALSASLGAQAGVCPAVGVDTDCGTIITITDSGVTVTSTGQRPYDDIEDTLVGVVNKSSRPIYALGLRSATDIFGFDGDGLLSYGIPGNALDSSGYGGPNAYFTNVNANYTSGTVKFITPVAPNGGTTYFSLEEAISAAISCQDAVNNAVTKTVSGANIDAVFKPNLGLSLGEAATYCGFVNFNWVQKITRHADPSIFYARNLGGGFDASVSGQVRLTAARVPFSDPPQGGGYTYSAAPDYSYPFYYDYRSELLGQETAYTLSFHDAPADPCLAGGGGANTVYCDNSAEPAGSVNGFTTHLAGVNADGSATDLGIGFTWTSDYSGKTGGVYALKSLARADGNGAGGVVVTSVQPTTDYQYAGVTVTAVNDQPVSIVIGDVNGDATVDCADLKLVKASFGKTSKSTGFDARADVVKDGVIDVKDLSLVARKLPASSVCK